MKPQLGAKPIRSGIGSATSQPITSSRLRPDAFGQAAGGQIGDRLGGTEREHEGQDGGARAQPEVMLADQRQDASLQADHPTDERVERDQERELGGVLAQAEANRHGHAGVLVAPRRLAATIRACSGGAGGVSLTSASANALGIREREHLVVSALEADRGDRVSGQSSAAHRPGIVAGKHDHVVGQLEQTAAATHAASAPDRGRRRPHAGRDGRHRRSAASRR